MTRILVPLDGSALAEQALPAAGRIALALDAELLLLHVVEASPPEEVHGQRHLATAEAARAYLVDRAAALSGIKAAIHVHEEGRQDTAKAIGEHVEELRSDLVVIATHGDHRFGRFLQGSVAQRALFFGGAPVLTIPAETAADPSGWRSLAIAVDSSGEHKLPLDWLGDFARSLGLSVELLAAMDTKRSLSGEERAIQRSMPGAMAQALEAAFLEAEAWLSGLASDRGLAGLAVRSELLRGSPERALPERLARSPGSILVIGTHGRAGLGALWEGSVASKLLPRLSGPVLLVRLGSVT
ncbi:MAG: universal stress protein [Treponema sp.]|nr:universal stress protein [Treponema sp.]